MSQYCTTEFAPILTPQYYPCFDCLIDNIASLAPYDATKKSCENNVQVPMGWNGNNSSTILSRFPIVMTGPDQPDYLVLPSTNYRRAVFTRLQLDDMSTFDFYCGFFISPLIAADLPYDGFYGGDGGDSTTQYEIENQLEAQDLIAFVKKHSGDASKPASATNVLRPAVIMGEWRSSIATTRGFDGGLLLGPDGGPTQPVDDSNPQSLLILGKDSPVVPGGMGPFDPVLAPDFTPQCNYCPAPENPYNTGTGQSLFVLQPFLYNWPQPTNAAIDESITFTKPTTLTDGTTGPISPYFGVNIRIQRPVHQ